MQVRQPFFKTLHNLNTLPGWSKGYDIFLCEACQFRKTSTAHFSLSCTFGLRKFEHRNFFLATFVDQNWQDLSRRSSSSTFQNCDRGGQCKVRLPLIKQLQLQKTFFITLTSKSVHVLTV